MKLLLHICCAPCSVYPLQILREEQSDVMGFFYRHNIHPWTECARREDALKEYAGAVGLRIIYSQGYELEAFIRNAAFREANRCEACYYDRLTSTARLAKRGEFDAFSSTLLYSKFQKHDMIKSIGEAVGVSHNIPFYYRDFREGWKIGVQESKRLQMYRQQYCGCIYSEKERFFRQKPP